jgi:hypothetical protein
MRLPLRFFSRFGKIKNFNQKTSEIITEIRPFLNVYRDHPVTQCF